MRRPNSSNALLQKMVQKLENEVTDGEKVKSPPSPKSRLAVLKRNKKPAAASDPFRFQGQGVFYKGKLIGERDVQAARGDDICAEAMRSAKAAVKAAGAHKTRIQLQINIEGIKILDEKSNAVLHNFPVSRISFVARDATDARAFGLVFGDGNNKYRFYGIKTAQTADQAVLAIRDMFQVVFEMKKKQIEQVKQQQQENPTEDVNTSAVAVADLLDLETELSIIEQGVHQLQQIPTTTDVFGATPFADPFSDSFASNNSSVQNSSVLANSVTSSPFGFAPAPPAVAPAVASPYTQFSSPMVQAPIQQQAWPQQQAAPAFQMPPPPMMAHQHHSQPALSAFSETNPFAAFGAAPQQQTQPVLADPFALPPRPAPAPPAARTTIDWGVNENVAPQLHHANTFAAFDVNVQNSHNWEDKAKRVTSLEDAFSKLVDMDDLVGPTETKKNPFEHILNPPKASLNSLTVRQPPPVVAAPSDPFGDDFFR